MSWGNMVREAGLGNDPAGTVAGVTMTAAETEQGCGRAMAAQVGRSERESHHR